MDTRNDPIEFSHEDQLGRASTAKVFAKALLNNPRRPMIVAVFGPWGSGKTSFANLLSADLRSSGAVCVWFNPWQFTNSDAMTLAFFDMLATSLSRNKEAEFVTTRECFFRYAEAITSRIVSSPEAEKSGRVFRAHTPGSGLLNQPPIQDQRDLLIKLFAASTKPIIVFIDDIDRLSAAEIRLLIQLVKSNADFPNLKFVLLFQKETIESALKTEGQTGSDFLEKIIEVPIELPLIRGAQYVDDLLREVAELFGNQAELTASDNERWQNLLHQGILKGFTTLRQKNRLLDRLHLHKWNMEGGLGIDINLVDLVSLEILRTVDYDLYMAVRKHGHLLTEAGDRSYDAQQAGNFVSDLISNSREGDHELGKVIVAELFSWFGGTRSAANEMEEERTFRICRSRHFPKYFFEGALPDEMSRAGRRRLEQAAIHGKGVYELLAAFQAHGLLVDGLECLRTMAQQVPPNLRSTVAGDIGRVVDSFGRGQLKTLRRSVAREGLRVCLELLQDAAPKERGRILRDLVDSDAVQLAVSLICSPSDCFSEDQVSSVASKLGKAIERAAADGRLEQYEEYGQILRWWRERSNRKATDFVKALSADPKRFVYFVRAITPYTQVATGLSQSVRTSYSDYSAGVLEFLPRLTAIRCAEHALQSKVGKKDEAFLQVLLRDLRARRTAPAAAG